MKNNMAILIIGAGKLGTSLFRALSGKGYGTVTLAGNKPLPESYASNLNENQYYSELNNALILSHEIIFICVQDRHIKTVAESLMKFDLKQHFIFHTSGFRTSADLALLSRHDTITGSFHPVQTFAEPFASAESWKGIRCSYEGHSEGKPIAESICDLLECRLIQVTAAQKQALHLSAAILTNFGVGLISWAEAVIGEEMDDLKKKELLLPMFSGMVSNYREQNIHDMLTGPLQRGDLDILSGHLSLLSEKGRQWYITLAEILIENPRFKIHSREKIKEFIDAYKV